MAASQLRDNPYVGPRAFERDDTLYGRDREIRRLLSLLIAERIVLLYSPSGAGKTSLIQAALIPELEAEGFRVWPAMRVNRELPPEEGAGTKANRYLLSLLLYLEKGLPRDAQTPIDELAGITLNAYLERRTRAEVEPFDDVFVFDQFEEILTLDPTDRDAKLEFFEQLGEVLQDRRRWALFAMREEFIAGLDPYLRPIPTRFSATYRLELLSPSTAKQAMQMPARATGVEFTDGAAEQLADDLRTVRVLQPDGTTGKRLGLYVEPVQLQVVCHHLWEQLSPDATQIVEDDLQAVGDVDGALANYYAGQVTAIAAEMDVSERAIREWVDQQLITEQGIRGQVLQARGQSRGLDNRVIWRLVDAHLVRAEERRGVTWFELAHDRLIGPLRAENAAWHQTHLSPMQRQALLWENEDQPDELLLRGPELMAAERWAADHEHDLTNVEHRFLDACRANLNSLERQAIEWESQGRPGHLLLHDQALVEAEDWAAARPSELTKLDRDFLSASQEARVVAARERRQARLIRWLAVGSTILLIIAAAFAAVASRQGREAQAAAATASTAGKTAEAAASVEAAAKELAIAALTHEAGALQTSEANRAVALTSLANAGVGWESASEWLDVSQERGGTIQALEATNQALAVQLTPTPSATLHPTTIRPTMTPEDGTPKPSPSPTRTAIPSPTATPTPNQSATAVAEASTAQAIEEQLAEVRSTQTAVASIPTPTAALVPVVCPEEPKGEFLALWRRYKDRLGCPRQIEATRFGQFAEQQFQNGFMFWAEKPRDLILVIVRGDNPVWHDFRTWPYEADGAWCATTPPSGLIQPIRGFGGVWCDNPEIRKTIGWAMGPERSIQGAVQEFEAGFIMRTGDLTKAYVLFRDDQTYALEEIR